MLPPVYAYSPVLPHQWYGCRQIVDNGLSTKDFFTSLTAVIFGSIQAGNVFTFVSPDSVERAGRH